MSSNHTVTEQTVGKGNRAGRADEEKGSTSSKVLKEKNREKLRPSEKGKEKFGGRKRIQGEGSGAQAGTETLRYPKGGGGRGG